MTIRDLIEKLTDAELDKKIDVVAWRREKGLPDTEKAYFNIYIAKRDQNSVNKKASTIIPEAGASMRNLIEKLTNEEMDKEINVTDWRKEKDLPDTEKAHLQAFICKKHGYKYIMLFDLIIPEQININRENHDRYGVKNQGSGRSYLPTKEDFEKAYRELEKKHKQGVKIDEVLDIVEANLTEKGRKLYENWRSITEQKIKEWSK